jgi:hypothetical protein
MVNVGVVTKYNEKKNAQLSHHSATTVVLDDVCVDGNVLNYYNVLKLVEQ